MIFQEEYTMIKVDLSGASSFFTGAGPDYAAAARAHQTLAEGSGLGNDFIGWLGLPQRMKDTELPAILEAAMRAEGFVGYSAEWWHFTDSTAYDVVTDG